MTAPTLLLTPKAAWVLAETAPVSEELAKKALVWAATQTVEDEMWLDHERWTVIVSRLMHCAVPPSERSVRWEWLVTAVSGQWGPMIRSALNELVRP